MSAVPYHRGLGLSVGVMAPVQVPMIYAVGGSRINTPTQQASLLPRPVTAVPGVTTPPHAQTPVDVARWLTDVTNAENDMRATVEAYIATAENAANVASANRASATVAMQAAIDSAVYGEQQKLEALKASLQQQLIEGTLTLVDAETQLSAAEQASVQVIEAAEQAALQAYLAQIAPTEAQAGSTQAAAQAASGVATQVAAATGPAVESAAPSTPTLSTAGFSGTGAVIAILAVVGALAMSGKGRKAA